MNDGSANAQCGSAAFVGAATEEEVATAEKRRKHSVRMVSRLPFSLGEGDVNRNVSFILVTRVAIGSVACSMIREPIAIRVARENRNKHRYRLTTLEQSQRGNQVKTRWPTKAWERAEKPTSKR